MAKQTGFRLILAELKIKIPGYLQGLKTLFLGPLKEPVRGQPGKPPKEAVQDLNPGVTLEIGNELMITDELVKMDKYLSNAIGRVVIIDQISVEEHDAIRASAFGIQVDVDMRMARQMREAFLQREQSYS